MDEAVMKKKDELANAITDVLENTLREQCGIHPTPRQSEKLHDFVRFELNV